MYITPYQLISFINLHVLLQSDWAKEHFNTICILSIHLSQLQPKSKLRMLRWASFKHDLKVELLPLWPTDQQQHTSFTTLQFNSTSLPFIAIVDQSRAVGWVGAVEFVSQLCYNGSQLLAITEDRSCWERVGNTKRIIDKYVEVLWRAMC